MAIYFVSDVHISEDTPESCEMFVSFLKKIKSDAETIYILGDLFDVFYSYKQFKKKFYSLLLSELRNFSSRRSVYFIKGNRDFCLDENFTKTCGVKILGNYILEKFSDKNVLLTHGDIFCSKDKKYQLYKSIIRSQASRTLFLTIPHPVKISISNLLRIGSKEHIKKSKGRCEIVIKTVENVFKDLNLDAIICGHIHNSFYKSFTINGTTRELFVLNDWKKKPSYVVFDENKFVLT